MSRVPPPNTGSASLSPLRDPLRLVAVLLEAQVEDLGAGRRRAHRGVGVEADEEVRLVVVGERRALVEADGGVAVARQDHAHAEPGLERRLQPPRDAQRHVLFERAAGAVRAVFGAAVARIDDDGADAAGRREIEERRGRRRRGQRCDRWRGWRGRRRRRGGRQRDDVDDDPSGRLDRRVGPRSGTTRIADRGRGPGSRCRRGCSESGPARRRRQRGIERFGLEPDDEPRAFLRDRVRCLRRDVERQAREGAQGFDASGDPGDADAADENQARGLPQLDCEYQARARAHAGRSRRARTTTVRRVPAAPATRSAGRRPTPGSARASARSSVCAR